jgi:hypothetical protein
MNRVFAVSLEVFLTVQPVGFYISDKWMSSRGLFTKECLDDSRCIGLNSGWKAGPFINLTLKLRE